MPIAALEVDAPALLAVYMREYGLTRTDAQMTVDMILKAAEDATMALNRVVAACPDHIRGHVSAGAILALHSLFEHILTEKH